MTDGGWTTLVFRSVALRRQSVIEQSASFDAFSPGVSEEDLLAVARLFGKLIRASNAGHR